MILIIFGIFSCILSIKLTSPLLRKKIIVKPNLRSSHKIPTPSGGGINFLISLIIYLILKFIFLEINNFDYFLISIIPLSIISFIDDLIELDPKKRYIFQLFTILTLLIISLNTNPDLYKFIEINEITKLFFIVLNILFLTAILNFINFMDGIDGLVTLCMSIQFLVISFAISPLYFLFVGILIGFIFFNWSPAKLFMGDVGSIFLGSIFSISLLQSNNIIEFISLSLIATPLLGDAFFCVIRRIIKGDSLGKPHKLHLYQRLNQNGWSHSKVSSLYGLATTVLALIYFSGSFYLLLSSSLMTILLGIYLDKYIAKPFK